MYSISWNVENKNVVLVHLNPFSRAFHKTCSVVVLSIAITAGKVSEKCAHFTSLDFPYLYPPRIRSSMQHTLAQLAAQLEGELYYDSLLRALYATDGSIYKAYPLAVALPRSISDLKKLVAFAQAQGTSLIPRTAGTSLAGQCVGEGIVVDVPKFWR
jgi:hypothetical protein